EYGAALDEVVLADGHVAVAAADPRMRLHDRPCADSDAAGDDAEGADFGVRRNFGIVGNEGAEMNAHWDTPPLSAARLHIERAAEVEAPGQRADGCEAVRGKILRDARVDALRRHGIVEERSAEPNRGRSRDEKFNGIACRLDAALTDDRHG